MQTNLQKLLVTLAALVFAASAYGQGTVNFDTEVLGTSCGPIYDSPDFGGEALGCEYSGDGTNFFAQLFAAAGSATSSSSLVAVGCPINFRSGAHCGYVQLSGTSTVGCPVNPIVTLPTAGAGGAATVQIRAWWGGGTVITTYDAAVASTHPNNRYAASSLLHLPATGGGPPPGTPVSLTGLCSFSLHKPSAPTISASPQNQVALVGTNVTFSISASAWPLPVYLWQFNSTNIAGATTSSFTRSCVQPADAGTYSVVVSNNLGWEFRNANLTVLYLRFDPLVDLPDRIPHLCLSGTITGLVGLEVSTNLINWVTLTNFTNFTGSREHLDCEATNSQARFYRALLP